MHIHAVQVINEKRAVRWHQSPEGLNEWSALEWAGAMCGEAGEAANWAKKLKRLEDNLASLNEEGRHAQSLDQARYAVAKEVADTIIYGLILISRVGYVAEDVIRDVFNKKSEEYGFPERL